RLDWGLLPGFWVTSIVRSAARTPGLARQVHTSVPASISVINPSASSAIMHCGPGAQLGRTCLDLNLLRCPSAYGWSGMRQTHGSPLVRGKHVSFLHDLLAQDPNIALMR